MFLSLTTGFRGPVVCGSILSGTLRSLLPRVPFPRCLYLESQGFPNGTRYRREEDPIPPGSGRHGKRVWVLSQLCDSQVDLGKSFKS